MLVTLGLTLNFLGGIVLLAANLDFLEKVLERVDPIHRLYLYGYQRIEQKSITSIDPESKSAYPYDRKIQSDWIIWPLLIFINRKVEQRVTHPCSVDIRGGHFKIDGEQLTFANDRRMVDITDYEGEEYTLNTHGKATLSGIRGLIYEARRNRIYFWGALGLTLGFGLQLGDVILNLDISL